MSQKDNSGEFLKALELNDINFITGVPDSLLAALSSSFSLNQNFDYHISPNEGQALALAIGHHIATNKIPMIFLQNSGLGNLVNPLISLAHQEVYNIPFLLVIGWRGEISNQDEPQHRIQGRKTLDMLKILDLPTLILNEKSDVFQETSKFINELSKSKLSRAILVSKNTFGKDIAPKNIGTGLVRKNSIKIVYEFFHEDTTIFATTGKTSRELYEINEDLNKHNCFYTIGGMGLSSSIALGFKISGKSKNVICLDGDGALLMHLGSLAMIGALKPNHFIHIVFDNKVHESVGGQPISNVSIRYDDLFRSMGYSKIFNVASKVDLVNALTSSKNQEKLTAIIIETKNFSDEGLERPKGDPAEWKLNFMSKVSEQKF